MYIDPNYNSNSSGVNINNSKSVTYQSNPFDFGRIMDNMSKALGLLSQSIGSGDGKFYQGQKDAIDRQMAGQPAVWPTTDEGRGATLYKETGALIFGQWLMGQITDRVQLVKNIKTAYDSSTDLAIKMISGG